MTGWNRVFDAGLRRPEVREAYQERLMAVLNEIVTEAWIEAEIAELRRQLVTDATRDRQKWGGEQSWENELRLLKDGLLERRKFLLKTVSLP